MKIKVSCKSNGTKRVTIIDIKKTENKKIKKTP